MGQPRWSEKYEPLVIDVSYNDWRYPIVTLSVYPGGRVTVTLVTRGLDEKEASDQALSLWRAINP